jgi:sugar phosphate isomerase/epimerase
MELPCIRIGNQTSKEVPWADPFQFALRRGFDAFEWFSDRGRDGWSEADMDAAARVQLRRQCEEAGLLCSVHAPYAADPVTQEGEAAILRSIEFAGTIGGGVVNLHLFPERPVKLFAARLGPLLEAARLRNVRLSLENTPAVSPEHVNEVFAVLAHNPNAEGRIGLCFDMGHANLHESTRNNYCGFLDRLGGHVPVIHWHAHENWGDRDSHLTLFTGPAARDDRGVRGVLHRLLKRGFAGSVVLEQWPHPPELLVQARDRLRQLLTSVAPEVAA